MNTRKLKFRAWNVRQNRWETKLGLYFDDGKIGDFSECFHNQEDEKDYIVQQFTGLLDKEGKEIFEGDILVINVGLMHFYYPVIWNSEYGCWAITKEHGGHDGSWFQYYRIAGNIFENPELLK